jgi:hypothetical protein
MLDRNALLRRCAKAPFLNPAHAPSSNPPALGDARG